MFLNESNFDKNEIKLIGGISFIIAVRTLGVSLLIPFLSIFILSLDGANPKLAGLAYSIFSISQAIFQIPMGKLSDKFGRKQITIFGLIIYFLGTIFSGLSLNIYHLIFARLLAGAGAFRGITMAWLTDGIDISKRNSALSFVGISIGAAVVIGFSVNSIIAGKIGIDILFFLCAAFTLIALLYTIFFLDNCVLEKNFSINLNKNNITTIFKKFDLLRLNIIGFIESFAFISMFFIMPILIKEQIEITGMWKIYGPTGIIGTCFMYFFSKRADREGTKKIATIALLIGFPGAILPIALNNIFSLALSTILIYSAHCILSPILPAAVSRYPNSKIKGTTMGALITFQGIGSSAAGLISGFLLENYNYKYIFGLIAILFIIAFFLIAGFNNYKKDCETAQ